MLLRFNPTQPWIDPARDHVCFIAKLLSTVVIGYVLPMCQYSLFYKKTVLFRDSYFIFFVTVHLQSESFSRVFSGYGYWVGMGIEIP